MTDKPVFHDANAAAALVEILQWPSADGRTLQEAYGPEDLAELILGNLNRAHLRIVSADRVV